MNVQPNLIGEEVRKCKVAKKSTQDLLLLRLKHGRGQSVQRVTILAKLANSLVIAM